MNNCPRLLLGLLFLWFSTTTLESRIIEVCEDCEVVSIDSAITQSTPGDTILIREGHYMVGNIIVDKPLVILGDNYPILDSRDGQEVLTIVSDSVVIAGLEVRNVLLSYLEDRSGIRIKRCGNFEIRDNRLINTFFGIYVENGHTGVISDNVLIGEAVEEMSSGNAIHLWYCKDIDIRSNEVRGHRDGIYLEFVDSSTIVDNECTDHLRYGLHFMFSNYDTYSGNSFSRNGAGVAVMFSKNIDMHDNLFEDNWGQNSYGLLLKEIYDANIYDNVFRRNSIGVFVEGSSRIDYKSNSFEMNGWAMRISGGCLDNVAEDNNFISNTFDLSVKSSFNNNVFDKNYWSEYSGYDLDGDTFGDVPHRPVKLFTFVVDRTPESIVLLRSFFIDILNFSEKVSPVLTPAQVFDQNPRLKKVELGI